MCIRRDEFGSFHVESPRSKKSITPLPVVLVLGRLGHNTLRLLHFSALEKIHPYNVHQRSSTSTPTKINSYSLPNRRFGPFVLRPQTVWAIGLLALKCVCPIFVSYPFCVCAGLPTNQPHIVHHLSSPYIPHFGPVTFR